MFMDKMVNKEVDEDVKEEMHQQEASDTSGTVGSSREQRPDRLTGERILETGHRQQRTLAAAATPPLIVTINNRLSFF